MKFGQLIEYNIGNISPEKSYTKYSDGKTIPRLFYKKSKLLISLDQYSNLFNILVCFYCIPSCGLSKYIEPKLQTTFFYLVWKFFKKQKEVWNQSPCLIFFFMIFEWKYLSCYILLTAQISLCGCLYLVRCWAIYGLQLFVN